MGFCSWITCELARNEGPITGRRCSAHNLSCGSCAIVKISLRVNWDGVLMEGNALAGAISQAFDRLK